MSVLKLFRGNCRSFPAVVPCLIILSAGCAWVLCGCGRISHPPPPGRALLAQGAAIFALHCSGCHGPAGEGIPGAFPPLKGDSVVNAPDPTVHMRTVLFGAQRRTVNGVSYTGAMPAWADRLSDEEIAAVIDYERTSWGNNAPTVTAEMVAKIRREGKQ